MMSMSVVRSSSGTFTIGRIAYRREGVLLPIQNALSAGKEDGCAQRGQSRLSTIALFRLCRHFFESVKEMSNVVGSMLGVAAPG